MTVNMWYFNDALVLLCLVFFLKDVFKDLISRSNSQQLQKVVEVLVVLLGVMYIMRPDNSSLRVHFDLLFCVLRNPL